MIEYKQVIEIFKMENELMKFNPDTGEKKPIELQNEDNQDLYKANLVAIEVLEKQLNNGWIPVSERLPEEYLDVLVFDKYKDMHIAHYKPDEGWILTSNQLLFVSPPVAWKPLPEPWEGEEE